MAIVSYLILVRFHSFRVQTTSTLYHRFEIVGQFVWKKESIVRTIKGTFLSNFTDHFDLLKYGKCRLLEKTGEHLVKPGYGAQIPMDGNK